jgi:hypothetical protein
MQRFFLSGQTTCAMLLGAGLLLRAQTALTRPEPMPLARLETPRMRPAELSGERAPRIPRAITPAIRHAEPSALRASIPAAVHAAGTPLPVHAGGPAIAHAVDASVEQQGQHEVRSRKGLARKSDRHRVRKCGGVALAGRQFRCG